MRKRESWEYFQIRIGNISWGDKSPFWPGVLGGKFKPVQIGPAQTSTNANVNLDHCPLECQSSRILCDLHVHWLMVWDVLITLLIKWVLTSLSRMFFLFSKCGKMITFSPSSSALFCGNSQKLCWEVYQKSQDGGKRAQQKIKLYDLFKWVECRLMFMK